ncbi:MAG: NlpC/P60 family protein [Actinobacteria bacterium]|nr:NlpC/P60 family protein [Actinomycetota bacterium]
MLALIIPLTPLYSASAKTPKPTLKEIREAKEKEAAKKREADKAQAKLNAANKTLKQLTAVANAAQAKYVKAKAELAVATKRAKAAAAHYKEATAAVTATHNQIGRLATNAYIMGSGFTDLDAVLKADGPQDLMDRLSILDNLGENNKTALTRYKFAEAVAQEAKKEADETRQAQADATERVEEAKKEADSAEAEQQKEVDKLQKVQDQLARELNSARKVRLTLEQQRQLALLEEENARRAEQTPGQAKIWTDDGFSGRATIRTSTEQRLKAVEFAKKQVLAKKPYVWGAEGPNSFDCSGLVYSAYRSAGLGWPNWDRLNSSLYWGYTKRIPLNQLEPGDLLFYSYKGTVNTIHHISIYAGDGMMWEAHSTKKGLLYSSIYSIEGLMPYGGRV